MKGLVDFFKDIFSFSDDGVKIGLSQFKVSEEPKRPETKTVQASPSEVKLSDLMRRSY